MSEAQSNEQTSTSTANEQSVESQSATETGAESQPKAQAAAPTPAETKKRIKQLQLKIDGQEFNEELPFEIDEDQADWYRNTLQLSKKAQKSMKEAATTRSQAEELVKFIQSDTRNALAKMGIDPKDFAAQLIEEEMQLQALSPEQRELQELKAQREAEKKENEKLKSEYEKKEVERLTQQEYERIDMRLSDTIEKSGLPKEPYVVKKMVDYMISAANQGVNLEPEDVIDVVKEEIFGDLKQLIQSLGEDKVEQFIGKDILDKIRKKNLQKAKATPATVKSGVRDVGAVKSSASKPSSNLTIKDFFKI